ncbi:hypothetical protein [Meiothermus taiwanensis]|jgi:hypothetical protein|uniref:Lipoprotein n=1 Tax=Meiothermus taiwanensis TaxID=172827 RepID=A0A399E1Z2_9DEIN|nr:hypothetical protein [Meiothermus taiwanensis]RIH77553.1 hypothetical protein Mcate_01287 [Meiothermus taiwanensis]
MRKPLWILLFGLLTLALSSCILVVDPPVSNFRFDSNWRRTSDGAFVFCTNPDRETYMRYRFRAPDSSVIARIQEQYVGFASQPPRNVLTIDRPISDLRRDGNDLVFVGKLTFGEGGVPQSLPGGVSQQSIVVNPITPPTSNNGRTTVTVTVTTISGRQYSGSYAYDTYANCP